MWRKLSDGEKAKFKGRASKKSSRKAKKVVEVEKVEVKKGKKAKRKGTRKLSGYMKFVQSERKNVMSENPNMAFGAVGKELGKRWGALSDAQKKSYS